MNFPNCRRLFSLVLILALFATIAACGTDDVSGGEVNDGQNQGDQTCFDHGDCDGDQICVRDEPGSQGICQDPQDNRPDGESCTDSAQCESGLCLDGVCTRECEDEEDCEDGWICRDHDDFSICEDPTPCESDRDCTFDGDRCVVERDDDLRVICRPPPGDAELGDSCSVDSDCAAGLCLDGECSQPCANPSDCGDGYACTGEDLGGDETVNVCTDLHEDACLSDADCDGGDRCVATVTDEDELMFMCGEPNADGGEGGDTCSTDLDCAQNLCLDGACAAPCNDDDVCSDIPASSCITTDVERDDAQGTVSVCDVPLPCQSTTQCLADETCYVVIDDDAVHTVCNDPNDENRADGQSCSDHEQCASNYCHPGRFGAHCSTPCLSDDHCPEEVDGFEMECADIEIEHGSGSDVVSACTHEDRDPCLSDDQCPQDQACGIVVNEDGDGLEGVCLPDNGGDDPGQSCLDHDDCVNQLCYFGTCSAPCETSDHCGELQECNEVDLSLHGQNDDVEICTDPESSPCDAPLHCDHEYMTCNSLDVVSGNVQGAMCGLINPGENDLGDECTSRDECESDFCWESDDGTSGECTVFCEESARDCASSQFCTGLANDLGACLTACDVNDECTGGNICTIGISPDGDEIQGVCDHKVGTGQTGDACSQGSQCETGLCLTVSTYEVTDQICTLDSECDAGFECICPPGEITCAQTVCVSEDPLEEDTRCSEQCTDDSDCAGGGHDLTACRHDIVYSWDGGAKTEFVSLCSLEQED